MKNNKQRAWIVLAVVFVLFTTFSFAIPFEKNAVLIIAYIFGVISIVGQIYVFTVAFGGEGTAKSRFYGFPIARIGITYLVVQIILSFVEMGFAWLLPPWLPLVINALVLGIAVVGCMASETMRDEIHQQDGKLKNSVSTMRELQSLAGALVNICNDTDAKKELEKLSEKFRYSDPVSSSATTEIETELKNLLHDIQKSVYENSLKDVSELIVKTTVRLDERNRLCAVNK